MSFTNLGLHPDLVRGINAMGWVDPTPIQTQAIPLALAGRDVLGGAQTGSGKTAAFVLPTLNGLLKNHHAAARKIRVLVLVPTRELAAQGETCFRDCGRFTPFKTAVIIGGVGYEGQRKAVADGAQIVLATPGRLLDHLKSRAFDLAKVEFLILDEADRMFDMGFLPDIRAILSYIPKQRQTLLFSATLAPEVEQIAAFAMQNPERVNIEAPTSVAEGISQILYPISQGQKADFLLTLLKTTEMRSVIVFTRTKAGADILERKLRTAGYRVGVLHSNRTQNERTQSMEAFRQGKSQILVATDIAARGIDVRNISHVVNYDVPQHPEDYVHRVGRTARAYGVGDAITLMDPLLEQPDVSAIERFIGVVFPRAKLTNFAYHIPPRLEAPKYKNPWEQNWGRRRSAALRRTRPRR
jgi:ATP-dependent RNA helicase RhlE